MALVAQSSDVFRGNYETVAASQTAQVLGPTGAAGDFLLGVLVIPATTSPGAITLTDGTLSATTIFVGGTVPSVWPVFIPINANSRSGAWSLTTGANVSAIVTGLFT